MHSHCTGGVNEEHTPNGGMSANLTQSTGLTQPSNIILIHLVSPPLWPSPQVFNEMRVAGIPASTVTYNLVLEACAVAPQTDVSAPHPPPPPIALPHHPLASRRAAPRDTEKQDDTLSKHRLASLRCKMDLLYPWTCCCVVVMVMSGRMTIARCLALGWSKLWTTTRGHEHETQTCKSSSLDECARYSN